MRGLKYGSRPVHASRYDVAPFTGAWIEISDDASICRIAIAVAPFTGAWIEIHIVCFYSGKAPRVAPFTGAWIEIVGHWYHTTAGPRRTLHGCVD